MAARKKKAKASKKAVKRTKTKKAPAKKAPAKARKTKKTKSKAARNAKPAKKTAKASKKAVARKSANKAPARKKKQIVGEGDYEASRSFLKDQSDFVKENKARIPEMGRDARSALEGSEGPSLLAAEAEAKSHSKNPE